VATTSVKSYARSWRPTSTPVGQWRHYSIGLGPVDGRVLWCHNGNGNGNWFPTNGYQFWYTTVLTTLLGVVSNMKNRRHSVSKKLVTVSIRKFRIFVLVSNRVEYWSNYSIRFEILNIRTWLVTRYTVLHWYGNKFQQLRTYLLTVKCVMNKMT